MQRSLLLVILFIITASGSISHLARQSKQLHTLKEDVESSLSDASSFFLENLKEIDLPKWIEKAALRAVKTYRENGVIMFYMLASVYILSLVAVIMMWLWYKSGFYTYCAAQILHVLACFVGFGLGIAGILSALATGLLSLLFIRFYRREFLNNLSSK